MDQAGSEAPLSCLTRRNYIAKVLSTESSKQIDKEKEHMGKEVACMLGKFPRYVPWNHGRLGHL
jgi:hypothetical protein